ncbi:MAG TPA: glycoside hydrolase family 130 protein [Terriglobales bacterium]|nr:glycoside hydrolase family 130 protein [Terriglobales bacterium]
MPLKANLVFRVGLIACLLVLSASAQQSQANPVEIKVLWSSPTPLISPAGSGPGSAGTFNPAAIRVGSKTVLLYREQDHAGTSRIGYASSTDGIHFMVRDLPVLVPEADYEKDGGVEDPRILRIADTYYLTYTGYNKQDAQLCMATSKDLIHWTRKGILLPAYKGNWNTGWTKSGAIVAQKINGKWWMYYLGTAPDKRDYMGIASSDDLVHWSDASKEPVLERRAGAFDSRVMEPGPPPLLTDKGVLLIYNAADDNLVYTTAWALFDKNDPTKLIARAKEPFLRPQTEWQRVGQVPNVVFTEGMVQKGTEWWIYYGGADKYIGTSRIRIELKR